MSDKLQPFRLGPWFSRRVWGRRDLRPWYESTGTTEPVGEAWLTGPESVVETGPYVGSAFSKVVAEHAAEVLGGIPEGEAPEFPLLIKLLFPEEKLSVQVHPDDAHARSMGQPRGKTECWYVLEAESGAAVGLGMRPGSTPEQVRAAIAHGKMEDLMEWVPVSVGDMVFVDAGTVHAIGPGLVLLETQQTSDTTFRMYDYGRPRELHVEQGLRAMKWKTEAGKVGPRRRDGFIRLIEQRYFTVDRYDLAPGAQVELHTRGPGCLAGLAGELVIGTDSEPLTFARGQAVVIPVAAGRVVIRAEGQSSFVRCSAPPIG